MSEMFLCLNLKEPGPQNHNKREAKVLVNIEKMNPGSGAAKHRLSMVLTSTHCQNNSDMHL